MHASCLAADDFRDVRIPEQFGPMVSLLLGQDSSWITGQVFGIDGGLTLRGYGGGVFPSA